jgi:hypothetical protein
VSTREHTVHVRINDAATGEPTPVRIRFVNRLGEYFAPLGHPAEFATGENEDVGGNLLLYQRRFAYIDGTCDVPLPPGPVRMEVRKGLEYRPLVEEVTLGPGQLTLRRSVERWTDLRREGWYSGDCRAHYLSPQAALLEAAAEDLAVVNLLVRETTVRHCTAQHLKQNTPVTALPRLPAIPNLLAFSGQRPALELPGHKVVVNTHNVHAELGSVALLNCHRPVFPLATPPGELGDWTVADWCDQCHRKGGLVVWTTPLLLERGEDWKYPEPLADLALGKIDAVEWPDDEDSLTDSADHWYDCLNAGFRLPLVGSSAKRDNQTLLGGLRTYVRLRPGEDFTYGNWIDAVRAGRVFVTRGPLISFHVNEQDPGAVIELPSQDQPVKLRLDAHNLSACGCNAVQLILNGELWIEFEVTGEPATAQADMEVEVPEPGWLAARCVDREPSPLSEDDSDWYRVLAHTSPVYIRVAGQPPPHRVEAVTDMLARVERLLAWVEHHGGGGNGSPHGRLINLLREACSALGRRITGSGA